MDRQNYRGAAAVVRVLLAWVALHTWMVAVSAQDPATPGATNLYRVRCTAIMQTRPDRIYCYATNEPFRVILEEAASFAHGEVFDAESDTLVTNLIQIVPTLLHAKVHRLGITNLPPPLKVQVSALTNAPMNYRRVAIVGRVTSHEWMFFAGRYIEIVIAESDGHPFRVNVLAEYLNARERLPVGTEVEFVGLSFAEVLVENRGTEVEIDLRNFDECRILRKAPWLTLEMARRLVLVAMVLAVVGVIWFIRERHQIGRLRAAEQAVRRLNGDLENRVGQRTAALQASEATFRALYTISSAVLSVDDLRSLYVRIHEAVRSVMPAENFFILLHNPDSDLHEYVYHVDQMDPWPAPRKVSAGLVGYVLRTGKSLRVGRRSMTDPKNEWHLVSGTPSAIWLGVPLRLRGKTIGVLAAQDYQNENAYTEAEEKILTYMASQVALAIDGKRTTEELDRFAAIAGATSDFVGFADLEGKVIYINRAGRKMIGLTEESPLQGLKLLDLLAGHSKEKVRDLVIPTTNRERSSAMEIALRRLDGVEVHVSAVWMVIPDSSGRPAYTAGIMRDISQRKRVEAELEHALAHEKELSDLKSRFVSMVSHEFRTPLGIILSSAEILDAYLDRLTPEDQRANLRDITQSSKHMASMMEAVLLLGRVEAGKMSCRTVPIDLGVLCAKLADEVRSATSGRCPISITAPEKLVEGMADESLLRHIFTNLLNNAVKYSPPGSPVEFTLTAQGPSAVFVVSDRGIGITEADQRQLYQAFHRGRNVGEIPGTGLGMVIVKHCVQLHGGTITFKSKEGEGTQFTVTLPIYELQPSNSESSVPPPVQA